MARFQIITLAFLKEISSESGVHPTQTPPIFYVFLLLKTELIMSHVVALLATVTLKNREPVVLTYPTVVGRVLRRVRLISLLPPVEIPSETCRKYLPESSRACSERSRYPCFPPMGNAYREKRKLIPCSKFSWFYFFK